MSRKLTVKEIRTVRIAAAGVGLYLLFFYGGAILGSFGSRHGAYAEEVQEARDLRDVIKPYPKRIEAVSNLMARFEMDPAGLKHATLVANANAAIQKTGSSCGVNFGPIRETPGRSSAKEAGSIQFDGDGQIPGVMAFLHQLDSVGYPVVVDSIQLSPQQNRPGGLHFNLTVVVYDFDAWKAKEEQSHA
jgi:hypothetical protein